MDRKLDAWIAENIFHIEDVRYGRPNITLKYTSDMNEAVHVLEKLSVIEGQHGYDFAFVPKEGWVVTLNYDQQGDTFTQLASHENPAMAICLAAYDLKTGNDWEEEVDG